VPDFPLGRVAGAAAEGDPKYFTINRNSWLPHQDVTKQGRRCGHATWSLDELWAAFPRVRRL